MSETTWGERLLVERDELAEKIRRLQEFLISEDFRRLAVADRELLILQIDPMLQYMSVLNQRVARLSPPPPG
jgi:hypothetical protein